MECLCLGLGDGELANKLANVTESLFLVQFAKQCKGVRFMQPICVIVVLADGVA